MPDIVPLEAAVASIDARTPLGSTLRSADWERVPVALRQRAQFSAGVESARVLQTIQDRLAAQLRQQREQLADGKQATFDRSSFINAVRDIARGEGLTPAKEELRGGVQDITSIPRLGLIYDMQNAMAAGFARHKLDTSEGALVLYPAYRLGASTADEPRPEIYWQQRWSEAGASVGWSGALPGADFVALKTSPIWSALSRFGTPWAPFDWGSTRELEEVGREEAIALGLIQPEDLPPENEGGEDFNRELEASVSGLDAGMIKQLSDFFGSAVRFVGNTVKWAAA